MFWQFSVYKTKPGLLLHNPGSVNDILFCIILQEQVLPV